jgi:phosphate transport system substrate-binding protein
VLTLLQLRDLYSGHLLSWADVGWASQDGGADVLLVSREDGSGTRRFFEEQVMGEERVALTAVVMPTSQDVIEYVAQRPQTIGYVSAAYLRDEQGDLRLVDPQQGGSMADLIGEYGENPVRIVPVEGLLPTQSNLADLQYHLSQPIFLVSQGEPTEWVRQFVDFALSPAGQQIVARFHGPVR